MSDKRTPIGLATYRGQTVAVLGIWREQFDVPSDDTISRTAPGPALADIRFPSGRTDTVALADLEYELFKPYPQVSFEPQI